MILLIDNYDSFTYNLKQYLMELNQEVLVKRNDAITVDEIGQINPSHIVISPGPGRPEQAGISIDIIKKYSGHIPILGVCLGHQAIGSAFGGNIILAEELMHGKTSPIQHYGKGVFLQVPNGFIATRYHSLIVEESSLPQELEITARSEDGEIMGFRHKSHFTEGVQFHPESIMTLEGKKLLSTFLDYTYEKKAEGIVIREALKEAIEGRNLSASVAENVMNEVMEGRTTDAQIAGLLTALRLKGETSEEITSFARIMREKAVAITPQAKELVDTCGTGGDGSGTFNISTAAAFVTAGAGISVAKHGNRSISSRSGSADVLEALNININLAPENVSKSIDEVGIGFLFAPKLHPAMKYAIGPRRELGYRTVFNILGPLTNPAHAQYQVMGVYSRDLVETIGEVLRNLGIERGFVVSSNDGLDEVSNCAATTVARVNSSGVTIESFSPEDIGYSKEHRDSILGGNAQENAEILETILNGQKGAQRDIVCLNAGFAIAAVQNISIAEAVKRAEDSIDSGKAKDILKSLIEFSNSI